MHRLNHLIRHHTAALFFVCLGLFAVLSVTGVHAQGRFDPVLRVDERVITQYQFEERVRFLTLLRAPGDLEALAKEQLTTEAIQQNAADAAGIDLAEEALRFGLEEFASRADLSADEFIEALSQNGVGVETFRDFVGSGLRWRDYITLTFADSARNIPQELVNDTLARSGTEGGLRVLLSEIRLPASSPTTAAASRARAAELSQIQTESEFNAAARQFSLAPSRARGGERNWAALESLPEEIQAAVANLSPGQTSRPVELNDTISVFFMREREQVAARTPANPTVDYAIFLTDEPLDEVIRKVDVCDDLYGLAKGLPENRLIRDTVEVTTLPADIQSTVARLDDNEAIAIVRSGQPAVVMLCNRIGSTENTVDFEIVGTRLLNEKLNAMASLHLEELRAASFIEDLTN